MPESAATLIARTRRFIRDYPEQDALAASTTSSATTITVAGDASYFDNQRLEIDAESMLVRSASGATITVKRGAMGSTPASHASAATILVGPHFTSQEILDALNDALQASWPLLYKAVIDESLTTTNGTYEYTIPSTIRAVARLGFKHSGYTDFRKLRHYEILRGSTSKFRFPVDLTADGTIRIEGFGPFDDLTVSTSLDAQFPSNAVDVLVWGAAQYLLASGEAGRVRADTGVQDAREQANRVGSSMSASNALLGRFRERLREAAMPPLSKHVKTTF